MSMSSMSLEEMCRELLSIAIRDGLVKGEINSCTTGDLVGMANRLNELLHHEHIIDCDAGPFVPSGLRVAEHRESGMLRWDATNVATYLSDEQKSGKLVDGSKLYKELADKPVLNANVLDWLLAHPHLIPEEWKSKTVFFWGTIYSSVNGDLCVRYLDWDGDRWYWGSYWLGYDWDDYNPAAVLAS